MNGHHPSHKVLLYCVIIIHKSIIIIIPIYNNIYSAGMKERCRDGCRTSLLIAGVVLVPAIFHTLLPPCHPYITIHFIEMSFSTCISCLFSFLYHPYIPSFLIRRFFLFSSLLPFFYCMHACTATRCPIVMVVWPPRKGNNLGKVGCLFL